ncbi:osmoprotectant transporter permease [Sphingomonas sp. DBB INV C78]|uniref:osmoprotectant transporter permease n=1 Tax=Sphingomonas sp. DBB INV C78 TaxID=3349434 RepID=UPI0036D3EA4E
MLFAFDAVLAAVLLLFFFVGITDNSVSGSNIGLWLAMLAGAACILGGGWWLRARAHGPAATGLLLVPALPGLIYFGFVLMMVVMQPSWR